MNVKENTMFGHSRTWRLNTKLIKSEGNCVIYWMQNARRVNENKALHEAARKSLQIRKPLLVCCGFQPKAGMNERYLTFLLQGLQKAAQSLQNKNIPFIFMQADPVRALMRTAAQTTPCVVYTDTNHLKEGSEKRKKAGAELGSALFETETDTVVPVLSFDHAEASREAFRKKLDRNLERFLIKEKPLPSGLIPWQGNIAENIRLGELNLNEYIDSLNISSSPAAIPYLTGGESQGLGKLGAFIRHNLNNYAEHKDKPDCDVQSQLSPFLSLGFISPISVVLAVRNSSAHTANKEAFLEEVLYKRELARNFTAFTEDYDSFRGAPKWALKTLEKHSKDFRPRKFTREQFENSETEDVLWNAVHSELILAGTIHRFLRPYWAKKILHWSASYKNAFNDAVYINRKYDIAGDDPNAYSGIAQSMFGLYQDAGAERAVFGSVQKINVKSMKLQKSLK